MNKEILVVDDEPSIREMLEFALRHGEDYSVTLAGDGLEAWDVLHRKKPDLLITNLVMPQAGGIELVKRIRADPRLRDLPIILLTGWPHAPTIPGIYGLMDGVIEKPFDLDHLLTEITELLR